MSFGNTQEVANGFKLREILATATEVLQEGHPENTRIYQLAKYVFDSLSPVLNKPYI